MATHGGRYTRVTLPLDAHERDSLRRQARILLLLRGAAGAGLCPIDLLALHAYAYLANVLAPVWDMPPLDGRILKRRGGPFYPTLQADLDRLVGMGVVRISDVAHVQDSAGKWRLEGQYTLHRTMAEPAIDFLLGQPDEARCRSFCSRTGLCAFHSHRRAAGTSIDRGCNVWRSRHQYA